MVVKSRLYVNAAGGVCLFVCLLFSMPGYDREGWNQMLVMSKEQKFVWLQLRSFSLLLYHTVGSFTW